MYKRPVWLKAFCDDLLDFQADIRIVFDTAHDKLFDLENSLEEIDVPAVETKRIGKETLKKLEGKIAEMKRYLE